jgi:hypothetical protein
MEITPALTPNVALLEPAGTAMVVGTARICKLVEIAMLTPLGPAG